jgi:hypothetical protein
MPACETACNVVEDRLEFGWNACKNQNSRWAKSNDLVAHTGSEIEPIYTAKITKDPPFALIQQKNLQTS